MVRSWSVKESSLNLLELTDVEAALVRAHEDAMIAVDATTVAVDVVRTGMTTEAAMIVVAAVVVVIDVAAEAVHIALSTQFGSTIYHHDAAGPN